MRGWQKDYIRAIYEPEVFDDEVGDYQRLIRTAILSIARKNGKTAIIAALVLCHLVGPEAILNGEIYSAATEKDQAALVFKMARQMVEADEELQAIVEVVESRKTLVARATGSIYRAVSAEAGSKHGFNPSVVIYDELAQAKNRDLFDALDTSQGARDEPLMIIISTQSADPRHVLSELIDDALSGEDPTTVAHVYSVDDDVENIFDEEVWYDANPALGDFRSLAEMRKHASRAERSPSFEPVFRNLYLNQRVSRATPAVSRREWAACMDKNNKLVPGEEIYLGLDLSATTDLSAMVAVSKNNGDRVAAWFWKPGDMLEEHTRRDRFDYVRYEREGLLEAPPGKAVKYGFIAKRIAEIRTEFKIVGLAYDRWRIKNLLQDLDAIGVDSYLDGKEDEKSGALRLIPFGQGFVDMAPAIEALEIAVLERTLVHPGHPILTFCFMNAIALSDPAGNRKLDKSATRFRIDGAVACTMAMGAKARDVRTPPKESVYEKRGLVRV